jgi:hypothetical protein
VEEDEERPQIIIVREKDVEIAKSHLHLVNNGITLPCGCKSQEPCSPNGTCTRGCCTLWICQDCGIHIKVTPIKTFYADMPAWVTPPRVH